MTFALFDEGGKFLTGRIMSQSEASSQLELESGKRVKVKNANIVLQFDKPQPLDLMNQAKALSAEIDLDLAWEFAPQGEFSFIDFAQDYYDANADNVQQVAILFRLFEAPHYFRRAGKGRFKKAPQEIVQAALLALERKKQQQQQIDAWAKSLVEGVCPQAIREQIYKILFQPDKSTPEYKAVLQASRQSLTSALDLFRKAGAIESAYQFHWKRFLHEFFPNGTDFPVKAWTGSDGDFGDLPLADVQAFSIDDSATTEIDDALSVEALGSGVVTLGIHIAVPGLGITKDDKFDEVARKRLSTVYMPGWKITMLPQDFIERFTLQEGHDCPALSLYVHYDEQTLEMKSFESRLERVPIAKNLRYDLLGDEINEKTLTGEQAANYAFSQELAFLFRLAQHLKAQREIIRGKPELFNRPDYSFHLDRGDNSSVAPQGNEVVHISERQRGSALDLIVSEAMIVANSTWGGWLASLGVVGIYRSQYRMGAGVKVRMGTKPQPHAGLGVEQYTWSTSPLRRYTDLVNQWQLIACVRNGTTAALVAPFKPKDAELFSIISAFESTYKGYNDFQRSIERYWTIRYIRQQRIDLLEVTVMQEGLVRANHLPLIFVVPEVQNQPRGTVIRVKIIDMDELTLDIHAKMVDVLNRADMQETALLLEEDLAEDDEDVVGPLSLRLDEECVQEVPDQDFSETTQNQA